MRKTRRRLSKSKSRKIFRKSYLKNSRRRHKQSKRTIFRGGYRL